MTRYSDEFKYSIIKRMMPPNNESVNSIARETGLSEGTLHSWKKKARANGIAVPGGEPEAEKWRTQDKFLIVVETASLSEIELAEYCRSKGLFVEQVEAWRDACMQANGGVANRLPNYKRIFAKRTESLRTSKRNLNGKKLHLLKLLHSWF
ncbi:transposase [Desulforamulus profundi]|uniref:Transposase n=1 Tax=Desulforamulus profundi TaxID=1383067 RepID=A0A2C6M7B3_9FIRM|nr:transposase [Desulforamulus profundi]